MKASWRWIIYRDSPRSDSPATADCHLAECLKVFSQSGRTFRDYHLLLDEQAEQIFTMIDPICSARAKTRDLETASDQAAGRVRDQLHVQFYFLRVMMAFQGCVCGETAIARPVSRQGRGKTPKSSLLHDDTACYWLFSALLLRGAEKNRAHHGFNPGCHLLGGDTVRRLKPAARGPENGPGRGGRG